MILTSPCCTQDSLTSTGGDANTAQPSKKSKKSVKAAPEPIIAAEDAAKETKTDNTEEAVAKASKKTRKRAADFLHDEVEDDAPKSKKGKKEVKAKKQKGKSLTTEDTNGAAESGDSDDEITITTTKPEENSMMAEAARTQDAELAEEYGSSGDESAEEIDAAPALLTGFDSDGDDPAEDKDLDSSKVAPIPQFKKTSKKLRKAKESKTDGPGAVYVGRIPHGFYESQMREYFSQFGDITQLRLSRNKKTGASKHFAFIEFASDEVAKIVAETMDNYLMFGHILKCKYAPAESLHPDVWKGANRKYRMVPQHKILKQQAEQPKTEGQIEKRMKKVKAKREKKLKQLEGMGYSYELPTLVKPSANGTAVKGDTEKQPAIKDKVEGALIPPPAVPKDELAVKVEEKKAEKKAKKSKNKKSESVVHAAAPAETVPVQTDPVEVANTTIEAEAPPKKSKKDKKKKSSTDSAPGTAEEATEEVAAAVPIEEPAPKRSKKAKKQTGTESTPAVVDEAPVAVEEAAPKKSKKAKQEAVVESSPAVVKEASTVAAEEAAPKKSKKAKKGVEETAESKKDKKQPKSILKKAKKA